MNVKAIQEFVVFNLGTNIPLWETVRNGTLEGYGKFGCASVIDARQSCVFAAHSPKERITMLNSPFPVYVGWDPREDIAYQVCRYSLLKRASIPVTITPIRQHDLRAKGFYTRELDPLASTEFTYTRFLVPHLQNYRGWALFCDCDFLWLEDIKQLVDLIDERYAVMCVHHDHRPREQRKMDNQTQTRYPRKNWSSMVLYNCDHPANEVLTVAVVNTETGAFLHRFQWLDDQLIGAVPETWNWLEGWSQIPETGPPNVVHMTRGGPWMEEWRDVDYADLWCAEEAEFNASTLAKSNLADIGI